MEKHIRTAGAAILVILWTALTLLAWFSPDREMSLSERRMLEQKPELSANALLSGSYMGKFEDYTVDQFPLRDTFRSAKALLAYGVLRQKDNNGIYLADGYAAKLEKSLNTPSVTNAVKKLNFIYEQYLKNTDSKIYMTIVPDKGYYLAETNAYPSMDYDVLFSEMEQGLPWAQRIDITQSLSVTDYYRTDTHWRQEKLLPVAQTLCRAMDMPEPKETDYTPTLATQKFYGVYHGQAALPMPAEDLYIMESPGLKSCTVYNHETGKTGRIYDLEKLAGLDGYDVYLSGAQALLTIDNPAAATEQELLVFRDSFGSSLVPLLVQNYRTLTLVDTRYMAAAQLGDYISFHGQDVLFAYSTLILNNSISLK